MGSETGMVLCTCITQICSSNWLRFSIRGVKKNVCIHVGTTQVYIQYLHTVGTVPENDIYYSH